MQPDGGTRAAYSLSAQLEATNKNALLLVPEIDYDKQTGAPGNLGTTGGFKALLAETLADLAGPLHGAGVADVGTLIVTSHSGGYQAAAGIASKGGVPVDEIDLFDSLYGNTADFDAWAKAVGPRQALHRLLHARRRHARQLAGDGDARRIRRGCRRRSSSTIAPPTRSPTRSTRTSSSSSCRA